MSVEVCPTCLLSAVRLISRSLSNTFQGSLEVHFSEEPPAARLTVKRNNGPEPVKKHLLEISLISETNLLRLSALIQLLRLYLLILVKGQKGLEERKKKKKKAPSMH